MRQTRLEGGSATQSFAKGIDGIFTDEECRHQRKAASGVVRDCSPSRCAACGRHSSAPGQIDRDINSAPNAGKCLRTWMPTSACPTSLLTASTTHGTAGRPRRMGNAPAALNTIKAARDLWKRQSKRAPLSANRHSSAPRMRLANNRRWFQTADRGEVRAIADDARLPTPDQQRKSRTPFGRSCENRRSR